MSRIAVMGARPRVEVWALAGALVVPVDDASEVERAWVSLPGDVEVVVVTPELADRLGERVRERLTAVLP